MTATRRRRTPVHLAAAVLMVAGLGLVAVPAEVPRSCGRGSYPNLYTAECLSPISTPTINGVPCVASKIGLCSSFVQNQQPLRASRPAT